jgi:hypothetical protein
VGWEVSNEEFSAVLALPAGRRYEYFLKRATGHGEVWSLRDGDGWVVAEDDDGNRHLPVWPHPRFAQACARGPWEEAEPVKTDVDEWVETWLWNLERDGMNVAVFQTPADEGVGVSPKRLRHDLAHELSRLEL